MHRVFRAITTTALVSSKLTLVGAIISLALFAVMAVRSFTPASALTTTPTTMNFQGRLLDSTGTPMPDGLYNMQFRLFTVASGGSSVWNETRETTDRVQVTGGLFSTQLGQVSPLSASLFASGSLYFEITLPTPATSTCSTASCASWEAAMTPRNLLATSAYAYNAETLDGMDSTAFAAASGSANYIQNTTSPQTADFTITGVGTAGTLQAATFDAATAGVLTIGGTNASSISIADDATLASGKTLRLAGDTRTNINAIGSPTEGMMTYDTTNKQLLTYANGKWQADGKEAIIVAASNSSDADKASADFVADGNTGAAGDGDQVQINDALTAASASGTRKTGRVVLLAGTYVADATILVPNNTTFAGLGTGTVIEFADIDVYDNLIEATGTTPRTGQHIRDLKLDGRSDLNTVSQQAGIYFMDVGSSTSKGSIVENITIQNFTGEGIYIGDASSNNVVQNNRLYNTSNGGSTTGAITIYNSGSSSSNGYNIISNNNIESSLDDAITVRASSGNIISSNTIKSTDVGIAITDSMNSTAGGYNKITDNIIYSTTRYGISLIGNYNHINWNDVHDNVLQNNGGGTANNGIYVSSADYNTITSNTITDTACTTDCYAINISNSGSDKNYLEANRFTGSAANAASINDIGTGTIYAGQQTNSTTSGSSDVSGFRFRGSTGSTTGFAIQNATATSVLNIDTTNGELELGSYNGGTNPVAGKIVIATTTTINAVTLRSAAQAGSYTLDIPALAGNATLCTSNSTTACGNFIQNQNAGAQSTSNFWISGTGRADTALISPALRPASDGTTALQIQNASGTYLVNFDTTNMRIEIASGSDLKLAGAGNTRNALTKDFTCTSTEAVNDIVIISGTGTVGQAPGGSTLDIKAAGVVVAKPATTTCTMAFSGVVQVYYGASSNPTIGDPVVTSGSPGQAMTSSTPAAGSVIGHALSGKDGSNLGWILLD